MKEDQRATTGEEEPSNRHDDEIGIYIYNNEDNIYIGSEPVVRKGYIYTNANSIDGKVPSYRIPVSTIIGWMSASLVLWLVLILLYRM